MTRLLAYYVWLALLLPVFALALAGLWQAIPLLYGWMALPYAASWLAVQAWHWRRTAD